MRFYAFLSVFATFAHKVAQTWFDLHETWHTTLLGIYYCVEVVWIENHCHMLEIIAQTWYVLHETWNTTLFGKYYCVEVVRIGNHSHMLEITC